MLRSEVCYFVNPGVRQVRAFSEEDLQTKPLEPVVRRAVLEATKPTDEESFKEWLRQRHQDVVNGFLQTLERDVGNYNLEDLIAFGRRQYARYLGKVI